MFGLFKKKPQGETLIFKIQGLHCMSCVMNIDGALEDLDGVIESKTHYAKAETQVTFDPKKVSEKFLKKTIQDLGYNISA